MSNINKRIRKLKKLLNKGRLLFVTLIYADGRERRMECNEAHFALDKNVVDYRWDENNSLADDNLIGAALALGPFDVRELFADGDDSKTLPKPKESEEV